MLLELMSVAAVRRSKRRVVVPACAAGLLLLMGRVPASAQRSTANARACSFLPVADLEAYYGGKGTVKGTEGQALSICSLTIGGRVAKVQAAQAGARGLPTTIAQGLEGAKKMFGAAGGEGQTELLEARDLGKVGCFTVETKGVATRRRKPKPLFGTTCFVVDGGYLNIALGDHDRNRVGFDIVRQFLDKAVARRK
jgi:hypothetical protein